MEPLSQKYRELIIKMMAHSHGEAHVGEHNVHQVGNRELLPFIDRIVEENLLPGSEIRHPERLAELAEAADKGEPCLLLLEHYSNFDLPVFHYLVRKSPRIDPCVADRLIAIAGIKLNESNSAVLAFTEAYSRLVIYPSRSIEIIKNNLKDPKELVAEMMRSATVNRAAMRMLGELKAQGNIVLVFPAGTRFRPWDPSTKRGVREIDSYLKSFSKMCMISVNGNILRINTSGAMEEDLICQDRVVYDVSPVTDCAEFRESVKREHHFRDDKKQAIVDRLMATLEAMHDEVEKSRL